MNGGTIGINIRQSEDRPQVSEFVDNEAGRQRITDYESERAFGFRQMGDTMIDQLQESYNWDRSHDVEMLFACRTPHDQTITYADFKLDLGVYVKIIDGGIGKDFIKFQITARDTLRFRYEARVYGRTMARNATLRDRREKLTLFDENKL